jgi:predicted ArsR family transcriptional regulator
MTEPLLDQTAAPALGRRRAEVLRHLREAGCPLTAAAVAERLGMHLNTARFHLDALTEQQYADRRPEERSSPGRPQVLYEARAGRDGARGYRLLARMLAGMVASLDPGGDEAVETGRRWGRELVDEFSPAGDALDRLHGLMEAVGFAPETRRDEGELRLHHCPFREVAVEHTGVVCRMHLGLIQGALDETGAGEQAERLVPFATPEVCIASLSPRR